MLVNERFLGIHHRIDGELTSALKQAMDIGANCMQIFVSCCKSGRPFKFSKHDVDEYFRLKASLPKFEVYVHATFMISLTTARQDVLAMSKRTLLKELELADEIDAKYLVVHPGSSKDHKKTANDPLGTTEGIKTMAELLNQIADKKFKTKLLLENTAYGKSNVGSNLQDFVLLKSLLQNPTQIGYCLDLAHAFAYGYQIQPLDSFLSLLNSTMGLENIALIHLNDSATKLASRIDQHKAPGEGYIGLKAMREFVKSSAMHYIPNILELPLMDINDAKRSVQVVKSWF